jgi:23S rRNA (cytidine1920-2'-O)/16S rRNA (cytidine1409-2'-O)-methyltransferase
MHTAALAPMQPHPEMSAISTSRHYEATSGYASCVPKTRIDQLLVARGLAPTRAKAQALILAGQVFAGDARVDKAGTLVAEDVAVTVRGHEHPFVSRGGVKLAGALDAFALDVRGLSWHDLGAYSGG